jgi:hypothetical protein
MMPIAYWKNKWLRRVALLLVIIPVTLAVVAWECCKKAASILRHDFVPAFRDGWGGLD